MKQFIGPKEVAKMMGVGMRTLNSMVRRRLIPLSSVVGRTRRWQKSEIESLLGVIRPWTVPEALPRLSGESAVPPKLAEISDSLHEYRLDVGAVVYFLVKGDEVVYVGQTGDLGYRMHAHRKTKDFDRVFYMRVALADALAVEAAYIISLRPKYNDPVPTAPLAAGRNPPAR